MAITTYTELQAAIANWLEKDNLGDRIPEFITLTEARLARELKTSELEVTTTLSVTASTEALPTNYTGMIRAHLSGTYPTLDYLPSDRFHSVYASTTSGRPVCYTIEANNILFGPSPDDTYTMTYTYIAKPNIASADTNRLLTIYPDLYLFGALSEGANYIGDTEAYAKFEGRFLQSIKSANASDNFKGALSIKLDGVP